MTVQNKEPGSAEHGPAKNTDREIWREREGDYYADSIFVTEGGGIGIDCGGTVFVLPVRRWHGLAQSAAKAKMTTTDAPNATEAQTETPSSVAAAGHAGRAGCGEAAFPARPQRR